MKHVVWVVFAAFLAVAFFGCDQGGDEVATMPGGGGAGGTDAEVAVQPPVACAAPGGLYQMTTVQKSGNCGPANGGIVNFDSVPQPSAGRLDPACTGSSAPSANGCVFTFEQSCALTGLEFTNTGKATWNADASVGKVTRQLRSASAVTGVCAAVYEDTYQRL